MTKRLRIRVLSRLLLMFVLSAALSCSGLGIRNSAESEFDRGLVLFNTGQYTEALPHFQKAATLDPQSGKAYLYMGRSLLNLGRFKDALHPLRTAYRLSPQETRKEVADIILDILLRTPGEIDAWSESQLLDFFRR